MTLPTGWAYTASGGGWWRAEYRAPNGIIKHETESTSAKVDALANAHEDYLNTRTALATAQGAH